MPPVSGDGLDRRRALKAIGAATLAMTTTACSSPDAEIVPYVRMPERLIPGTPLFFATATVLDGYAQPVVVETHEGRPTKVEGNPDHPASRGAADAFAQAQILSLYDPSRSRAVMTAGRIDTIEGVLRAIEARRADWAANGGAGLRLLTGAVTSPSLANAIAGLQRTYPALRWHRWQAVNEDSARAGAETAFGRRLDAIVALDKARVVVAIDADPLGPGPDQVRAGRAFAEGRRARRDTSHLTRLHVVEPAMTLTGASADTRLALPRSACGAVLAALAAAFGGPAAPTPPSASTTLARMAAEMRAAPGAAVVLVGEGQPPAVHALAHWLNGRIGALGPLVGFIEPAEADPVGHAASLRDLTTDMAAGRVDTLLVLGSNPGLDAPPDVRFADALRHVPLAIHHGLHVDETALLCRWHVPALHAFESWTDARTRDGRTTLVQPLVAPIYDGHTAYSLIEALAGREARADHDVVQEFWRRTRGGGDFDAWWRQSLHDGIIADSASAVVAVNQPALPSALSPASPIQGFEITFAPDPSAWDGRFAENAWLQETPHPVGKHVWGNAAALAAADATRLGVRDGDLLRIAAGASVIEATAWIAPGHATSTIGLTLGQGRRTGALAPGLGYDAYPLRPSDRLWAVDGATVTPGGRHAPLRVTQAEHKMDGRDIVRSIPLASLTAQHKPEREPTSLYPATPKLGPPVNAYAMVIDQSVCIGCNACVVACRAENNVPVVGPDEILAGRDMAWLRVDSYETEEGGLAFQPVPCMHCEKAPCEPVCPVGASVHDSDGLNVQVYNRCIGTRFCEANCPYGVRRFNFFGYGDGQEHGDMGAPILQAMHNPDVSVRARGVMEKCTYCVQRISRARRTAEKEDRPIRDGDVTTACQQTCPVDAIVFGDLKDATSAVSKLRDEPHEYGLLAELGTRPRTTYLARVRDEGAA